MAKLINRNIKQKKFKIILGLSNENIIKFLKRKRFKLKSLNVITFAAHIQGIMHIKCSFNNTLITLTDPSGKIKIKSSSGVVGFKGSKRSSKFAAQTAIEELSKRVYSLGFTDLNVHLNGFGRARKICIKSVQKIGLRIHFIKECTSISYNGCRPSKIKRL
jgi:small subunit ribosomal protein S11